MIASRMDWGGVARTAGAAGLVGGVAIDAFLYVATVLPQHGSIIGVWQYVASALVGKIAFSSMSYALLGLLVHFAISIAWAGGYAYIVQGRPSIAGRPIISGLAYGFIVWLFMQIVLIASNNFAWPSGLSGWIVAIVAHTVFFGLPISLVTARLSKASAA